MNGLEFRQIHGRAWTRAEMLREQTDLGELDGLIAAMERNAVILSDPRQRPTAEERAAYATRRAELAKAAAIRAAR